jgi:hypothetical protein
MVKAIQPNHEVCYILDIGSLGALNSRSQSRQSCLHQASGGSSFWSDQHLHTASTQVADPSGVHLGWAVLSQLSWLSTHTASWVFWQLPWWLPDLGPDWGYCWVFYCHPWVVAVSSVGPLSYRQMHRLPPSGWSTWQGPGGPTTWWWQQTLAEACWLAKSPGIV